MESHESSLFTLLAFTPIFLILTSFLREFVKVVKFPYTVSLLILGFFAQFVVNYFHIHLNLVLGPEVIFYIILPILLFEATIHLNIHQFKLQFRTISFLATFGVLLSMFIVAAGITYFVGFPFGVSLLFGALISATDPIAVLAIFKTLGAPKRLSLLADGESMFNDATAVIAFRLISSFVVVGATDFETHRLFSGITEFVYIFLGSLTMGFLMGYLTSLAIAYIKNDKLTETTLTMVLAFGSFYFSEHLFGLSGVITCVIAGITLGNLGKTKISEGTMPFIKEIWEYLGFVSLSLVFFFAAYNLDFLVFEHDLSVMMMVILTVLIARAVTVYSSFFVTNRLQIFKDEPNVPLTWQHVINWGGLRGVIPLVLVLSLPDHFVYKADLLAFTMGTLLFTLFVNGLTIENLLIKLNLHLPKKEEDLIMEESSIFDLEDIRKRLKAIRSEDEFDKGVIDKVDTEIVKDEEIHKAKISQIAKQADVETSLKVESIEIEKQKLVELFFEGYIPESVYYGFEAQLDLQLDALEYPEVYKGRGFTGGGYLRSERSFRLKVAKFRELAKTIPFIPKFLGINENIIVQNRYALLRARLVTAHEVFKYLDKVDTLFKDKSMKKAISSVRKMYLKFEVINKKEIAKIRKKHPDLIKNFQEKVLHNIVDRELAHAHAPSY